MRRLRYTPVAAHAGYHAIGACIIRRFDVTSATAAARSGLTCLVLHIVVVGWTFGCVGYHATIKGVELSFELDYVISFWSGILS